MSWWTSVVGFLVLVFSYLWSQMLLWLSVFIAPMKNWEMLWIIIPIWINWFFTEFFQEKKGTSLGNAVTNGGVMAWVGVDWIRYMVRMLNEGTISGGGVTFAKFALSGVVIFFGIFIIIEGVRTKHFVHFLGRVRQTTYVLLMVSPVIYGVIEPSWSYVFAVLMYAPLFYYAIELIDRYTPNPKTYEEAEQESASHADSSRMASSNNAFASSDPFNTGQGQSDPFSSSSQRNSIDDTFKPF